MTKRFCDVCERPLTEEDDKPFIRQLQSKHLPDKVVVTLMVTNEYLHVVNDVCNKCKIKVINEGSPYISPKIATLQPLTANDPNAPKSTIPLFIEPEPPSTFSPFIPSQPAKEPQPEPETVS